MKGTTCKAALCYEFGKPLVIEEVTIDPPEKGEVKVRIAATGVCHSDIHDLMGDYGPAEFPAVAGHEVAGYVEEVGEGVTAVKPGDPVLVAMVSSGCGQCYFCNLGLPNACEKKRKITPPSAYKALHTPGRYINKEGKRVTHLCPGVAGFVEYTVVDEKRLLKLPADMPLDSAALLACGVITGFCPVINIAQVKPFSSVVVVGTGGVGLNTVQGAALSGAYPIIAVDVLDNKLEAARTFGATHTINVMKEKDPVEAAYKLTSGRGADYVFVTVGGVDKLRQGFKMSGYRGMTVAIGVKGEEYLSDFQPLDLMSAQRILTASGAGAARLTIDIPRIITLYQAGRYKLDELITGRYPLERINEAIESTVKGEALRNVIVF